MKKTILISLAAVASLAAAAPALAQPFVGGPAVHSTAIRYDGIDQRIGDLTNRVQQAQRWNRINQWQAQRLQTQLRQVRWMEQRFRDQNYGRLTNWQTAQLNGRLDQVGAQLNFGGRDDGGRGDNGRGGYDNGPGDQGYPPR